MPSIRLLVLAPTTLFAFGCVPQSQYDSLLMANNTLEENQAVVEAERDEALARIDDAEARVSEAEARYARSRTNSVASVSNLVLHATASRPCGSD